MIFLYFFVVLEFELRAYTWSTQPDLFGDGFFKIEACELFVWAGFELRDLPDLCFLSKAGLQV
jgi:hypothetical protein